MRRIAPAATIATILALSSCATRLTPEALARAHLGPKPSLEQCKAEVGKWLKWHLKDPDSAHIDWPEEVTRGSYEPSAFGSTRVAWTAPADINGKNSMGAYEGYARYQFFFLDGALCAIKWPETSKKTGRTTTRCEEVNGGGLSLSDAGIDGSTPSRTDLERRRARQKAKQPADSSLFTDADR